MARVIEAHLKKPLADEMLFGRLQKGGRAKVARGAQGLEILPKAK